MPHDMTLAGDTAAFATAQEFWEQATRREWSNDQIFDEIYGALIKRRQELVDELQADHRYGVITQAATVALDIARLLREGAASDVSDLLQAADLLMTVALDDLPHRILSVRVVHVRGIAARMTGDEQLMRRRRPITM